MCSVVSIKTTVRLEMFWCYCSDWCPVKGHTLLKKTLQLSDTGLSMNYNKISIHSYHHCVKSVQNRVITGPYFPVFGLDTKIYSVNLRIQSQ